VIYYRANNTDHAIALLSEYPDFLLMCGSTDVTVTLKKQKEIQGLIDISHLDELRYIEVEPERIRIGAMTTISDILEDGDLQRKLPLLTAASEHFASRQIRNLATLGGNIANASPAADLVAVLLVLRATVTLGSVEGERCVALEELFCGYKCTKLAHEMILAIDIPLQEHTWYYRKTGVRERLNIAKVSLAVVKSRDGYAVSGASLNPYAVRFTHVEEVLNAGHADDAKLKEALEDDISPSGSFRSTKAYRMRVAFNMLKEALSVL
jgi:CO/xanthine dehydrogenase FAD-binding subunit